MTQTSLDDRRDARLMWAGIAVSVVLGFWLTADAWGARPQDGGDVMGHLLRTDYGLDHIVGERHLDGWFPRLMVGHQAFLFYGPGFAWLLGIVKLATFGVISTIGAMKVLTILSFVLIGPAVAFLARSLGVDRFAAGLAAVLALAVNSRFGVGLTSTFEVGLVPHQVTAPLFCVVLGAVARVLNDGKRRWWVLAAASLAALVVTHPITVMALAVLIPILVAVVYVGRRDAWPALRRLGTAALAAAGVAAFWLIPYLAHRDLRGPVATWTTPPLATRLDEIIRGRELFATSVGWLVAAGLAFGLFRAWRGDRRAVALVLMPVIFLLVAHGIQKRSFDDEVSILMANRGLGYAGLVAVISLAVLLAAPARRGGPVAAAAALFAGVLLVTIPGSPQDGARQMDPVVPQMRAAARVLRDVVPERARFAVQRDFPLEISRLGVSQPYLWLGATAQRNLLNVFNGESSASSAVGYLPDGIGTRPPGELADALAKVGTTHVVTIKDDTPDALVASGRFRLVWRESPLAVLTVVQPSGQPDPSTLTTVEPPGGARIRSAPASDDELDLAVTASRGALLTIALAWSPKWHAWVDDRNVQLSRTADGLLTLPLPAGASRVHLEFGPDGWDRLGELVSVATIAGLAARAYRRRRSGDPAGGVDAAQGAERYEVGAAAFSS